MPHKSTISALDFDVLETNGQFALAYGDEILTTNLGHQVIHERQSLISHMISELDHCGQITLADLEIIEPRIICAYAFYSIQRDWIEPGTDQLTLKFADCLGQDATLFRCAGPEQMEQIARWLPLFDYLDELKLNLPSLSGPFMDDPTYYSTREEYEEAKQLATPAPEFVEAIEGEYQKLSPAQKAVVLMFFAGHDGMVLFPMLVALGLCSPNDYASAVVASHLSIAGVTSEVGSEDHASMFKGLKDDARTAIEFLEQIGEYPQITTGEQQIIQQLKLGETKKQEFKSTLRWNIHAKSNDDKITHSCLKTIAAFLNSYGGKLFIGVDDNGSPVGIELDKFKNADKFMLHLKNVIKQSMGPMATTLATPEVIELGGKNVCVVTCERNNAQTPILLKFKSADEEYFVRAGPSTEKLSVSYILEYEDRRKKRLQEELGK